MAWSRIARLALIGSLLCPAIATAQEVSPVRVQRADVIVATYWNQEVGFDHVRWGTRIETFGNDGWVPANLSGVIMDRGKRWNWLVYCSVRIHEGGHMIGLSHEDATTYPVMRHMVPLQFKACAVRRDGTPISYRR